MQKNKLIPIIFGIVVIASAAAAVFTQTKNDQQKTSPAAPERKIIPPSTSSTVQEQPNADARPGQYTLVDVALHNTASSCWSAVNGAVYDLTAWIAKHPGGEDAILSICGKDGSDIFNNQHGGKEKQEKILQTFKIGALSP